MDPYLESHWEDVHTRLISYTGDAIQTQLSEDLIARIEEKVYVEDDGKFRLRRPDVRVVEAPLGWEAALKPESTAVLDEPLLLEAFGDPIKQRSVLIYDSAGNRIITAIEILSPWNKAPGRGFDAYMEKREKYLESDINLIEVDLVRAGDWTTMIGAYFVPQGARTTYRVTVVQPEARGPYLYPISLRGKLPTIKIPLRPVDTPARLNLQELVEKAYEMGRYDRTNYAEPCSPPLSLEDAAWAQELLKADRKT